MVKNSRHSFEKSESPQTYFYLQARTQSTSHTVDPPIVLKNSPFLRAKTADIF